MPESTAKSKSKSKSTYCYKLFRVKRSDGRVTTVSVNPVLVTKACQVMGGPPLVGKLVRETALTYEDGMSKSCSGFVSEKLRQALQVAMAARREASSAAQAA